MSAGAAGICCVLHIPMGRWGITHRGCNPHPMWRAIGDARHNQVGFVGVRFTRVL